MGKDKNAAYGQTALWKIILTIAAELLLFGYLIYTAFNLVKTMDIFLILMVMIILPFPIIIEKHMSFRINGVLFVATLLYICGDIFGTMYCLFASTFWFDKLMHFFAGFLFASLGYYHLCFQKKCEMRRLNKNIFTTAFSIMISVLWEIFEYSMDTIFHLDMQYDTFVNEINTHLISDSYRVLTQIGNVNETVVNGTVIQGYIDIGLHDTMNDLLMGTIGALIFVVYTCIDKDRHPLAKKV